MLISEAGVRWCPFSRVSNRTGEDDPSYNRFADGTIPDAATCWTVECAVWRKTSKNSGYCGLCKTN